jgi:hypothetical protein
MLIKFSNNRLIWVMVFNATFNKISVISWWSVLLVEETIAEPSWSWSYGAWIYNYLCSQCLSPLMLWVQISIRLRCTTLCDKVCQWLATGRWFSLDPLVSSTNKTDHQDITEILLTIWSWPRRLRNNRYFQKKKYCCVIIKTSLNILQNPLKTVWSCRKIVL